MDAKSAHDQNGINDLGIDILKELQELQDVESKTERPLFTILSRTGKVIRGVVYIDPTTHLTKNGDDGWFQYKGPNVKYQRIGGRDEVYRGLVDTYQSSLELLLKKKDKEALKCIPSKAIELGTDPDKTLRQTKWFAVMDGGTRMRALREAAKNVKLTPEHRILVPHQCTIYERYSEAEMAAEFVKAQKARKMNPHDAINAEVISGTMKPIYERVMSAQSRGLFGDEVVVTSRAAAKGNPKAILLGSFLEYLCWGVFGQSNKAVIPKKSNELSQDAVDNYARTWRIFTETVGRKRDQLKPSSRGHCLDSTVFMSVLSRLVAECPLVPDGEKRRNTIQESELRYWLTLLISENEGETFRLYSEFCRPLCSAGKKGIHEITNRIASKGIVVGSYNNNKRTILKIKSLPCTKKPELLAQGKSHPEFKNAGRRCTEKAY